MVITTRNSVYTFVDKGDGAFEMTSTNARQPGPVLVRFEIEPEPGPFGAVFLFLEGDHAGRHWRTSSIVEVQP